VTGESAMHSFAGPPQPVEIHHAGIWYSGELLGWRHEERGVVARVRCRVDGLRHTTWKDLSDLRLPDPRHPPRKEALAAALGRPAPTEPDVDDRTRPHVLRAGASARPPKPVHAVTPPAPRGTPVSPSPVRPAKRRTDPALTAT
jgi:hypothetical protein